MSFGTCVNCGALRSGPSSGNADRDHDKRNEIPDPVDYRGDPGVLSLLRDVGVDKGIGEQNG